jgi:pyruvate dehydrogenase E1 component beta subunit
VIAYGGTLGTALAAATEVSGDGIEVEVVDLRSLRPLDDATLVASVSRTHRAVVVDEGWRSGSLSAEVTARLVEHCFFDLDAPVERVCSAEVPMPYAQHLEQAALPSVEGVVHAIRRVVGERA